LLGCNDLKNWLPADALGWRVGEPAATAWDGLERFVPSLRAAGLITAKDL
jgi:hypothetical protein